MNAPMDNLRSGLAHLADHLDHVAKREGRLRVPAGRLLVAEAHAVPPIDVLGHRMRPFG